MPIYEYTCERCGGLTELLETAGRKADRSCDACGSKKLRRAFSTFAARSKSSAAPAVPRSRSGCASCRAGTCAHCRH